MLLRSRLFIWISVLFLAGLSSCNINFSEPELKGIESFNIGKSKGKGYALDAVLNVYNPNKFKIKLHSYDLDVALNQIQVGKASSNEKLVIGKQETTKIPVSVNIDLGKIGGGILGLLPLLLDKSSPMKVDVNGFVTGGAMGIKKKLPISISRNVDR